VEQKVLSAAIKSRDAFEQLVENNIWEDLSDKGKILFQEIEKYYTLDTSAKCVDVAIIIDRIHVAYPKHAESFKLLLESLPEVSIPNLLQDMLDTKKQAVMQRLSLAFATGKTEDVDVLLEQYKHYKEGELHQEEAVAEVYKGTPVSEILKSTDSGNKIKLLPQVLNPITNGGVLRGNHIVIFAPTDMGKSLFALNMAYGFLKQGLKVLYVGNEDPAEMMITRLLWRLLGMVDAEMRKNMDILDAIAVERGYNNFIFGELAPGTPYSIRKMVEEERPDVLIIDQIRNLDMGEKNFVRTLESAAQFVRAISKEYDMVGISLTQAADSATGKIMLGRGDIDNSNVGIPGTADLMIGIGANEEMEMNGHRMLSIVKNKLSGVKEPQQVLFRTDLTKVEGI